MSITFDEFQELDLRTGTIEQAEEHPNADKLYVLSIDIGEDEPRQSVAGVKSDYGLDDLEGTRVAVLTNLENSTIRGETSEVMILAADADDGLALVGPDQSVPAGTPIH